MLRPYQQKAHDEVYSWISKSLEPCLIEAATGCHEKGHKILMADGTTKPVEKIKIGDKVCGLGGSPRTVLKLHCGQDRFYKITPTKGEPFRVNAGHIFSLYVTPARKYQPASFVQRTADQVARMGITEKHRAKLWRSYAESFSGEQALPIDPWVVGALIGDGCLTGLTPCFCTPDREVVSAIASEAERLNCKVNKIQRNQKRTAPTYSITGSPNYFTGSPNYFTGWLRRIGIMGHSAGEKFVPDIYKTSSLKNRLELIAGLIDTDGHLSRSGFDWISKSPRLADDFVFLCRSVGLSAYMTPAEKRCQNNFSGIYYRVSVSGDCNIIPCKIVRKRAPKRRQIKRSWVTGFKIEEDGVDEYFGFELDGDRLYMDGSFTVHHNSGKSHIIAAVAKTIHSESGMGVLCIAPSAELVEQNREKYLATGNQASMYSASAGQKCLRHPVVFGTPGTLVKAAHKFKVAAVVIDEAHGITPTVLKILKAIPNPYLRIIGLSATPYRLGSGYIYRIDENGEAVPEHKAADPYFTRLVYKIQAHELIDAGFLTKPAIGMAGEHYDTSRIDFKNQATIEQAFEGHGRLTAQIVADIVEHARHRMGVMIFASTVPHAEEVLASLPPGISALVTGKTPKRERRAIIERFKAGGYKYLVNVSVLTTGFDAPHVDLIAILRATESAGLHQQIIGRGLRLHDQKRDCLVLDYAENIERHYPHGDIFDPDIKAFASSSEPEIIEAHCPACDFLNRFIKRKDWHGEIDHFGYALDDFGEPIDSLPAHHGRRCRGIDCSYRWTFKECPSCKAENDIAAKRCCDCGEEIIDPNEKLRLEYAKIKRDPYSISTERVVAWQKKKHISRKGNECTRIDFSTDYRSGSFFIMKGQPVPDETPETITYVKSKTNGFFRLLGVNEPDECPELA